VLKSLAVPRRDPGADHLLLAEQAGALDVARPSGWGQRDEGWKAEWRSSPVLDLWAGGSTG